MQIHVCINEREYNVRRLLEEQHKHSKLGLFLLASFEWGLADATMIIELVSGASELRSLLDIFRQA